MNEKYSIMTPFNIIHKMLGPYMFSPTARETLNDKMELYFHDHSFVPLFVQASSVLVKIVMNDHDGEKIGELLEDAAREDQES